MQCVRGNKKRKEGMSLVEAVVVVALFTLISFVVLQSIASFYQFNAPPQNIDSIVIVVRTGNLGWGIVKNHHTK